LGIEAARQVFPGLSQVAVFDTAFHRSMPPHAFMYAPPYNCVYKLILFPFVPDAIERLASI
jgi:acetate kinase